VRCIRFLIHINTPVLVKIHHPYLRHARHLRPDWSMAEVGARLD
jgi:chorismate mutase